MLAASGMNFPEVIVLSRILQPRLVVYCIGATLAMDMLVGTGFFWLGL